MVTSSSISVFFHTLEAEPILAFSLIQDGLYGCRLRAQTGNDDELEGVDATGGGCDLVDEPAQEDFSRRQLEYQLQLGFEGLGGRIDPRRGTGEGVAAFASSPTQRRRFDLGNPDTHDRVRSGVELDFGSACHPRRSDDARAVGGFGKCERSFERRRQRRSSVS